MGEGALKEQSVLYEKRGEVAYITLNRPDAKNAVDVEMHRRLRAVWHDFRDDPNLRAAILTGAGDAFCAGADLKSQLPLWVGADAGLPRRKVTDGFGGAITRGLHRIYKPIIAAVNGWALGGGFELALACDIRIASEQAQFGSPEVRYGLHHMDSGIVRLVNIGGLGVALGMLLTGDPIDAWQAERWQLVNRVVPADELMATTEETVKSILKNDQVAIESAKETALEVIGRRIDDALSMEALLGYSVVASNPAVEERLSRFYKRTESR